METEALKRLEETIRGYPSVLVSLSGGVDSSLVATVASSVKGNDSVAVTLVGPSMPSRDRRMARRVAQVSGIKHIEVEVDHTEDSAYAENPVNRCYYCRRFEGERLYDEAQKLGFKVIADGVHLDDLGQDRPGIRAMDEWRMRHPLVEARLRKAEIRLLARTLGLPNYNEPAGACLSSRVAHGELITPKKLAMIDSAEDYISSMGFRTVRVRVANGVASVEVSPEDVARLSGSTLWDDVTDHMHSIGFSIIASAPREYRKGGVV